MWVTLQVDCHHYIMPVMLLARQSIPMCDAIPKSRLWHIAELVHPNDLHLLRKPLEGARNHGVGGFVTGIGKASAAGLIFGRLTFGACLEKDAAVSRTDFNIPGCQGLTSSVIKSVNGVAAAWLDYVVGW